MTTNVIRFRRTYLVKFLQYHFSQKDRIAKYIRTWIVLNATKPPIDYIQRPSSKLAENEFVVTISTDYKSAFYLSFAFQKKLENIVLDIFDAVIFKELFSSMWREKIEDTIEKIRIRYDLSVEDAETIRKRFYRLRKELYEQRYNAGQNRNH